MNRALALALVVIVLVGGGYLLHRKRTYASYRSEAIPVADRLMELESRLHRPYRLEPGTRQFQRPAAEREAAMREFLVEYGSQGSARRLLQEKWMGRTAPYMSFRLLNNAIECYDRVEGRARRGNFGSDQFQDLVDASINLREARVMLERGDELSVDSMDPQVRAREMPGILDEINDAWGVRISPG